MIEGRLGVVRRFLRGGRARVRHCGVRWRERLFVISRFVCVEGPVVVRRSLAMVSHGWPVIRHPSEILLVVILRPELIGSSALGVVVVPVERIWTDMRERMDWMDRDQLPMESLSTTAGCIDVNSSHPSQEERELPVIIISVASVVSITVVLFIGPLAGEVIWSVVPRASVGVSTRSPVPVVVVLVPVLLVLVVPFPSPHLVAVAAVVELSISLPVSPVCNEESIN